MNTHKLKGQHKGGSMLSNLHTFSAWAGYRRPIGQEPELWNDWVYRSHNLPREGSGERRWHQLGSSRRQLRVLKGSVAPFLKNVQVLSRIVLTTRPLPEQPVLKRQVRPRRGVSKEDYRKPPLDAPECDICRRGHVSYKPTRYKDSHFFMARPLRRIINKYETMCLLSESLFPSATNGSKY